MKKIIFSCIIAVMLIATQQVNAQAPTGVRIFVYPALVAGTLSGGVTPLCYNGAVGLISGTLPTGGQGTYTYQWSKSTNAGVTWAIIPGATGQNYDPGNLIVSTQFRRADTDPCGVVTTNIISIVVYGQFIAGVASGGNTPLCNGGDGGTITSTAGSGGAPGTTYQWEITINGGLNWNPIPGETALTHVVGLLIQTSGFRLAFNNPSCGTLYSNIITITVYAPFLAGTVTGGNTPICWNTNAGTLTSTAPTGGAAGTTLQWESSTDGLTYNPIVGQTNLTLILGNLTQNMWYRLRYTNLCGIVYSNITDIVVYAQFVQGAISLVGSTPICYNTDPGSFNGTAATGGAPGTTYQWQSSTNGGATWAIIPGATLQNYDPGVLTATTVFRRQDVNPCNTLYTNSITIVVYNVFNPGVIGMFQSICSGSTPALLTFITPPTGGDGIYTYQWEQSSDGGVVFPWTPIPGATNSTYQPPALFNTNWFRVIVSTTCGSGPALP